MKQLLVISLIFFMNCMKQTEKSNELEYTNDLINESSPYLLQHARNPVNWKAWNTSTLKQAKAEQKLIIISVGYSACHWCHVMEHESFEDTDVAKVMNENFINIKVDREERPDIDHVYMNAVQIMTGRGGWPMNVIALPDGRPIWGGTYFTKNQWVKALNQVQDLYTKNPNKLIEYASKLEEGIKALDIVSLNTNVPKFETKFITKSIENWSRNFDWKHGGLKSTQKFMMPNNYHFLLRQAYQNDDKKLQDFVNITLTKIAQGGVYDHVGGGFSRYSVDEKWHVPHFEKMLYDNAQLVSLYADAYLITKNDLYKNVVLETLEFIKNEMSTSNGAFYSSYDADSTSPNGKLEEGAYYTWTKEELKSILNEDFKLFSDYYNVNSYGFWEHKNYVLIKTDTDAIFTKKHKLSITDFDAKKKKWKQLLYKTRSNRPKPRLDDKTLTSWNALMLKGYVDAYRVMEDVNYLKTAKANANFIIKNQLREDGGLNHSFKNNKSTINGYLEDYATTIEAFIALYEVSLEEQWLTSARDLANYSLDHFYDSTNKIFFFTSNEDPKLVSRNIEYRDNVIPASNSIMAKNLLKLSHYYSNTHFYKTATSMLNNVLPEIQDYPSGFSNWLDLMLNYTNPYYEVAIVGENAKKLLKQLNKNYIPNKLIVGSTTNNDLPLLKNRYSKDETLIYVCVNKACKLPVKEINKAKELLKF